MLLLSIVIPCFNEVRNLPRLLKRFKELSNHHPGLFELILVDNGSTDETSSWLDNHLAHYPFASSVRVELNQGYGDGIARGLSEAQGTYCGWTHADMQCDPLDFKLVIERLQLTPSEHCFLKGLRHGRPYVERCFTFLMSCFESILFQCLLRDIAAQPTVAHRHFINTLLARMPADFNFDLFMLVEAKRQKLNIWRFSTTFSPRTHGMSSWNRGLSSQFKLSWTIMAYSLRLRMGRIQ